ncbi:hypothetical protein BE221DRAFT_84982 [Ostreococcus tauri]|uniref:Uncharacterized protein n=1 Tax=Ostreococcus tauri TaxID=70448 RepID=A0A1Y5I3E4_OSTTA|nr:hypothetical protein BE221DRAFT_84982 [Ostreococcus tauri]
MARGAPAWTTGSALSSETRETLKRWEPIRNFFPLTIGVLFDARLSESVTRASATGSVTAFSSARSTDAPVLFKNTNSPPSLFEIPSNSFRRAGGAPCIASVAVGGGFGQAAAGPTHAPPLQYRSLPLSVVTVDALGDEAGALAGATDGRDLVRDRSRVEHRHVCRFGAVGGGAPGTKPPPEPRELSGGCSVNPMTRRAKL